MAGKFRILLSFLFALLLGAIFAFVVTVGYVLPGFLPTTDVFMFILESPLGKYALEKRGGEGGLLIAIVIRAFTCSVLAGAVAGAVLHKIRFQRAFCYAALWVPLVNTYIGYLAVSAASASSPGRVAAMQQNFGQAVWADLWIYGWYFLALYISFLVTNSIIRRSAELAQGVS